MIQLKIVNKAGGDDFLGNLGDNFEIRNWPKIP